MLRPGDVGGVTQFSGQRFGIGQETLDLGDQRRSVENSGCSISTAAPTSLSTLALSTWWFSAAPGHGTTIAGAPTVASSAIVPAPARVTSRSAAA